MEVFSRLREYETAEPFRPFSILLSGGQEVPVPHPEVVNVFKKEREVHVTDQADTFVLSGLHIVGFRFAERDFDHG